ncbi:TonB-linked outer membrane protein, SusC/RagA family [Chryseolinea serpens]|uniref:TonB-linked outer membrane protein, SusC/RagA family n=1 Tax=Chryseolinea serpens TaxID=947013 RepID=A0A1M5VI89_9BACT|nr:TonB-dependent receptor [Chryseolinea serpens]SHH74947.1 TonB-linked outer membrane protein, SusC/RagA family [Chryseolinea serpens]
MKQKSLLIFYDRAWRPTRLLLPLILLLCAPAFAQSTVKGKITDAEGQGMPGVNILLKNSTTGTTSDSDGNYVLSIPASETSAVLVFSFIGYDTQEETVGDRTTIDLKMNPNLQSLSEIVVVGYGTAKKSDVTGALVRVDEQTLREVPTSNISLALQGRAAGVTLDRTSSRPGAPMQIRIRGNRSLGAADAGNNDPLIVVDGIPFSGSINDINPDEIAAIDILKDASATAIYGSRGSNGVVLISTKRGKVGKPTITYDGYYGVSSAIAKYDLYDGQEYAAFRTASGYNGATPADPLKGFTADEQASYAAGKQTDWQDEVYKKGYITNHNIGLSGGVENTQYGINAGYFKETTVLPGQAFTRYSLRATLDQKVGERVKIGLNTLNSVNITDGENANPMFQVITLSPLYRAHNDDGSINELPATGSIDNTTRNPLLIYNSDLWKQQRKRLRTFNSLYGEVKLAEGLKYRLNVGLDYYSDTFGDYRGSNTPFQNGSVNTAQVKDETNWSYTLENLLTYDKTFAEKHKLNFTGLFSVQELENTSSTFNMTDVLADPVQYYNPSLANTFSSAVGTYSRWGLLSYMGRVNYNYNDRYLLTLTARADGSSRLAEGNKWFYYPAAALAWNIHNETFLENVSAISNLKLRLGYGKTSNQAIAPYSSLGQLTRVPYNFGTTGMYGLLVQNVPNPGLSWEFTTTANIGLDFGLLRNRVTGSIELYQQKTSDILQNRTLPVTAGIPGAYAQNIGKTENKGLELTLSTVNIEGKTTGGFTWTTDLNYFLNREEITYLADGATQDINNGWFVGHPVDVIYDYKKIGIWQTEEAAAATAFDGSKAGYIKVADLNGSGVADPADRTIIGTLQPKWQGGMTNRFSYKGFDLSIVLFARVGGSLVSTLYQSNPSFPINTLEGRRNGPKVDYWTPDNPTNEYPKPASLGNDNKYGSTLGYFDATFMKIRSINLGYKIPEGWLGRTGLTSVRIYVAANNPFKAFFSPYVDAGGLDPEATGRGSAAQPGWGQRLTVQPNTPLTRSLIVGLSIKY